jgi:hypothetical protein
MILSEITQPQTVLIEADATTATDAIAASNAEESEDETLKRAP